MQKIVPFLWFDNQAREAAEFYVSVFGARNQASRVTSANPLVVQFELAGEQFMALNGGPAHAHFTEAISLYINCESQEEVDYFWDKLTADGGYPHRCGWLKDKYGLSWQIVPTALGRLMGDPDPEKSKRVMDALLKMDRLIIADLEKAYRGE